MHSCLATYGSPKYSNRFLIVPMAAQVDVAALEPTDCQRYSYRFFGIPSSLPWNLRITKYSYRFLSIPMAAQNYQIFLQILQNSYGCPGGHCRPGSYRCSNVPMDSYGCLGGPAWSPRIAILIVFLQTWIKGFLPWPQRITTSISTLEPAEYLVFLSIPRYSYCFPSVHVRPGS